MIYNAPVKQVKPYPCFQIIRFDSTKVPTIFYNLCGLLQVLKLDLKESTGSSNSTQDKLKGSTFFCLGLTLWGYLFKGQSARTLLYSRISLNHFYKLDYLSFRFVGSIMDGFTTTSLIL